MVFRPFQTAAPTWLLSVSMAVTVAIDGLIYNFSNLENSIFPYIYGRYTILQQ
jgi:hypothetical protein